MHSQVELRTGSKLRPLELVELENVNGGFLRVATPTSVHSVASDGAIGYLLFRLGWGQSH